MYAYNDTVLWSTFVIRERTQTKKNYSFVVCVCMCVCLNEFVRLVVVGAQCMLYNIIYSYIKWNYTIYTRKINRKAHEKCKRKQTITTNRNYRRWIRSRFRCFARVHTHTLMSPKLTHFCISNFRFVCVYSLLIYGSSSFS